MAVAGTRVSGWAGTGVELEGAMDGGLSGVHDSKNAAAATPQVLLGKIMFPGLVN
jgi:hypothetical protein